ncbi:hypothetical protein J4E81_007519 [Alternaria sp. BMP 2799]|nr:hypothetical protein J4E81_007519 [Alternaria sp. BMP 2799]
MTSKTTPQKRGADQLGGAVKARKLRRSIADRPSHPLKKITVLVGKDSESFTVDKDILSGSDLFKKKNLDVLPKTDRPNSVNLPDVKPRAFIIYLWWLETGIFYMLEEDDVASPAVIDEDGFTEDKELNKWSECYILGNAIQDCGFQDACIDWIQEKMLSEGVSIVCVPGAVYGTDDQLQAHRQFVVDLVAHVWPASIFNDFTEENCPAEFMIDLVKYIGQKMRQGEVAVEEYEDFFKDVGCKYHAHVALNKPCYKKTHPAYK